MESASAESRNGRGRGMNWFEALGAISNRKQSSFLLQNVEKKKKETGKRRRGFAGKEDSFKEGKYIVPG